MYVHAYAQPCIYTAAGKWTSGRHCLAKEFLFAVLTKQKEFATIKSRVVFVYVFEA